MLASADETSVTAPPEISFNALVVSLATSAAVHFGDAADPSSGRKLPPNLAAAGHMLDLLAVLAEKTHGNLTPNEKLFLTRVLQELRMRFSDANRASRGQDPVGGP